MTLTAVPNAVTEISIVRVTASSQVIGIVGLSSAERNGGERGKMGS
jgi:hypothetical protein